MPAVTPVVSQPLSPMEKRDLVLTDEEINLGFCLQKD